MIFTNVHCFISHIFSPFTKTDLDSFYDIIDFID